MCRADAQAAQQVKGLQDALATLQQGLEAKQTRHEKISASLQGLGGNAEEGCHNEQLGLPAQPAAVPAGVYCNFVVQGQSCQEVTGNATAGPQNGAESLEDAGLVCK